MPSKAEKFPSGKPLCDGIGDGGLYGTENIIYESILSNEFTLTQCERDSTFSRAAPETSAGYSVACRERSGRISLMTGRLFYWETKRRYDYLNITRTFITGFLQRKHIL